MPDRLSSTAHADVDPTKDVVEHELDVIMARHSSAYRGGDYWLAHLSEGEYVIVQANAELGRVDRRGERAKFIVYIEGSWRASNSAD